MHSVYKLQGPKTPDWGDYSDILVSGMASDLMRQDGMLELERTGPFVPAITLPGPGLIVVTDAFKKSMEGSDLTGFTFRPVIKSRIVRLEWERWDRTADEPEEYPETGEPEDYILGRRHSPQLAKQIG